MPDLGVDPFRFLLRLLDELSRVLVRLELDELRRQGLRELCQIDPVPLQTKLELLELQYTIYLYIFKLTEVSGTLQNTYCSK